MADTATKPIHPVIGQEVSLIVDPMRSWLNADNGDDWESVGADNLLTISGIPQGEVELTTVIYSRTVTFTIPQTDLNKDNFRER